MSLLVQSVAELVEDIWDRYGNDFGTDYSGLFKALSHVNYNVRVAAAEALAAALDENPDTIQVTVNSMAALSNKMLVWFSYGVVMCSGISFSVIFLVYS